MNKPAPASSRAKSRSLAASEPSGSGRRLGDLAYRRILEGLFDRRVPAGSFISQGELVRLLDVPIQPLREALRVLETEGILKIHARSGIEFLKADMELARSTYQFRSVIERSAARAYAETANLAEITGLLEKHRTLLELIERDGITEAAAITMEDLEQRFHGSMIGALRNPMIETTARRLKNYVDLIRLDVTSTPPRMIRTLREHIDVLEACHRRDTDEAEAALGRHFQAALQRILGMV
ncbi:GntR family transcriptional regulator [Sphingomonas sp. CFBP 8760]|uniref:GntR family transcriptional regulator n=1 Tax=Sphingomonas sp. CFBP 8760 TaxID=2775282 RepID=UPI00178734ED|nr:GntR family transcriptional regulator [Sphingomonas sp. CFBP 8760]MBD8546736.1 GntR family transcriptional regulator [Sphingomonas sp. CFBP 8760]